jgi:hypothetical protein
VVVAFIAAVFEGDAAFEATALTGEAVKVHIKPLVFCSVQTDWHDTFQKGFAAQFPAANAEAADHSGFIANAYLTHFDTHPEFPREVFYEVSEIDAPFGRIEKYGFPFVCQEGDAIEFNGKLAFFDSFIAEIECHDFFEAAFIKRFEIVCSGFS